MAVSWSSWYQKFRSDICFKLARHRNYRFPEPHSGLHAAGLSDEDIPCSM